MYKILGVLLCVLALPALAQSPGPQCPEGSRMREQEWRIPGPGGVLMDATVFRPPGNARAPLVVVNHGAPASADERPVMKRPEYLPISSFFVARGYVVVLPLRRGYGATGGHWAEQFGPCDRPDYVDAGLQGAADIHAALDYMRRQPFVLPDRTLVVGHSAGGWGTVALSSLRVSGVPAMIAFAPGRGGHQINGGTCTPEALVKASARYGSTARVPLLWITAANDTFFGPKLAARMVEAYDKAGGDATYRHVAAFGDEGHFLGSSDSGAPIWHPLVEQFLQGK